MTFELRRHARNVHSLKFKLKTQKHVQSVMLLSDYTGITRTVIATCWRNISTRRSVEDHR